jgi:hypothetical protein
LLRFTISRFSGLGPIASSLVAALPSVFLNNILNNKVKISPRYTTHQAYGYGRSTARVIFGSLRMPDKRFSLIHPETFDISYYRS